MLSVEHVTKRFGTFTALEDVSLTFEPGVYGLVAPNGAGKTTLIKMLATLLFPTEGQILWDGEDIVSLGESYRARLGYLPQDFGYYPDFTALDFMLYLAALKGIDRHAARRRSLELLETVGLADVARVKVRTFSGGMKQRLGIAQAVLNDPAVLVLDEPTAGLDPKERVRFRNLIASFAQDKIVVLSTHIVSDVEYVADEILVMRAGSFIMRGAPAEVVEALPADSVSVIAFFSEGAALKSRSSVPAQRLPTTSTSAANAGTMARQRGRLVLFSTSFILLSSRLTAARQPVSNPAGTFSDWYRWPSACSKAPLGSFSRSMRMPPFLGNKRA